MSEKEKVLEIEKDSKRRDVRYNPRTWKEYVPHAAGHSCVDCDVSTNLKVRSLGPKDQKGEKAVLINVLGRSQRSIRKVLGLREGLNERMLGLEDLNKNDRSIVQSMAFLFCTKLPLV